MPADVFDTLFDDYRALRDGPLSQDPSGLNAMEQTYPKVLLLASASYLEVATTEVIAGLFHREDAPELGIFVERRSLKRQFHSLFDWENRKSNQFFSYFGDDCKARFLERMKLDTNFSAAVEAFLEIGALRNKLVHQNYAQFQLDKTAEEIKVLHRMASTFPQEIPSLILVSGASK
ncbi:HEPN domain-containing protein [Amycolatopsis mediterranei]|uniref:HEPN domain-containing protein n=1 Tax=Amycolatopsis mediterranei TaxID=33910 RepID=UPI00114CEF97|nr:HEPN domain-containing protein [Amycolatopsis mediterranei]UZF75457.1 HEPN domain-containing protein [Amycolatopsis mediterranei]